MTNDVTTGDLARSKGLLNERQKRALVDLPDLAPPTGSAGRPTPRAHRVAQCQYQCANCRKPIVIGQIFHTSKTGAKTHIICYERTVVDREAYDKRLTAHRKAEKRARQARRENRK